MQRKKFVPDFQGSSMTRNGIVPDFWKNGKIAKRNITQAIGTSIKL
jgi:hypothetical protein